MINLFQNNKLTVQKLDSIKETLWKKFSNSIINTVLCYDSKKNRIDGKSILSAVDAELKPHGYSLETIFKATYKDFDLICSSLRGFTVFKRIWYKKKGRKTPIKYNVERFFENLYEKFRTKCGSEYVKSLEVVVCPYCNRNYIDSGNNSTTAELDHFLDKKNYPWLSITVENLIPCCPVCNHLKGNDNISYSPYDNSKTTDELLEFMFFPKSVNRYAVFALPSESEPKQYPLKENIKIFKLNTRYQINSEEINELIIKYRSYSKNYLNSLNKTMKAFMIELKPEEIYYGTPLSESKYYLRPLSKFRRDILRQIENSK